MQTDELEKITVPHKPDAEVTEGLNIVEEEDDDIVKLMLGDALFEELECEEYDGDQNKFSELSFKRICQRKKEVDGKDSEIS